MGDQNNECRALILLARIKFVTGDRPGGQTQAREAQRVAKISGIFYHEARVLHAEALCTRSLGDYKGAIDAVSRGKESLSLCGMSDGPTNDSLQDVEAEVHLLKSEYAEARRIHQKTIERTPVPSA